MAQLNGTVVYKMVEKGGRVPPAACLVLSCPLWRCFLLLNCCSSFSETFPQLESCYNETHNAVRGDVCVALPWQIDRPELKILVGIFCQILEIMQELHNNQDVQAGCDAFVESGADLLPFKCVIQ